MSQRSHAEIDDMLDATVAEYADEERAAADEESAEKAASAVFSVRLPADTYAAVREAAARAHLTPSALIRQWVSERVEEAGRSDLAGTIALLRRDVERLAELTATA